MANFSRVIDQNFHPNTPIINGCANSSSFRDVAHVLTYWCKAVWAMRRACKSMLKLSLVEYLAKIMEKNDILCRKGWVSRKIIHPPAVWIQ
jgi:hypothetical protein